MNEIQKLEELLKARDRSHLVKKVITNRKGHQQTVFVRPGEREAKKDSPGNAVIDAAKEKMSKDRGAWSAFASNVFLYLNARHFGNVERAKEARDMAKKIAARYGVDYAKVAMAHGDPDAKREGGTGFKDTMFSEVRERWIEEAARADAKDRASTEIKPTAPTHPAKNPPTRNPESPKKKDPSEGDGGFEKIRKEYEENPGKVPPPLKQEKADKATKDWWKYEDAEQSFRDMYGDPNNTTKYDNWYDAKNALAKLNEMRDTHFAKYPDHKKTAMDRGYIPRNADAVKKAADDQPAWVRNLMKADEVR